MFPWLYGKIRNLIESKSSFWKQHTAPLHDELQEEQIAPDESRAIEAPEGASEELCELWDGTRDPFEWLESQRGRGVKEIDYQILVRMSDDQTLEQIGAALGLSGDGVRKRVVRLRAVLLGRGRK